MSRNRTRPRPSRLATAIAGIAAIYGAGAWRTRAVFDVAPEPASVRVRYKDGIYTGAGRRRHGRVAATVTVKGGRLASVDITLCDTRFPCTYLDPLPAQVLARQRPDVDAISGATESAQAFSAAVADALAKARRPEPAP